MAGKRTTRTSLRSWVGRGSQSVLGRGDLATSLILIFPLFLAYEVGVMFSSSLNGVDFVTRWVYAAAGNRTNFLLVHIVLAAVVLAYVLHLRRTRRFSFDVFPPVLMESAIYALTLGTFIVFVMQRLLGLALAVALGDQLTLGATSQSIVTSLGAGVHEELVFRLGLMCGAALVLKRAGLKHGLAIALALVGSAVVFSAAHHIGPQGEAFEMRVFTYRALAGVIFGLILYYRSLAHAVYSHFLYDFYVLVVRS